MSAAPAPRTRTRPAPPRSQRRDTRPRGAGGILVDAAQILLGATLSCLLAALSMIALGAVILLIIYLTR